LKLEQIGIVKSNSEDLIKEYYLIYL